MFWGHVFPDPVHWPGQCKLNITSIRSARADAEVLDTATEAAGLDGRVTGGAERGGALELVPGGVVTFAVVADENATPTPATHTILTQLKARECIRHSIRHSIQTQQVSWTLYVESKSAFDTPSSV